MQKHPWLPKIHFQAEGYGCTCHHSATLQQRYMQVLILWWKNPSTLTWTIPCHTEATYALLTYMNWTLIFKLPMEAYLWCKKLYHLSKKIYFKPFYVKLWAKARKLKLHIWKLTGRTLFNQKKSKLMQMEGQLLKSLNAAFSFAPPSILSLTICWTKYTINFYLRKCFNFQSHRGGRNL